MAEDKKYGLILPKKGKPGQECPAAAGRSNKRKNVFGEEESSDEEQNTVDWVKQSLKKQSTGSMQQRQSMKVMKKALEDDPSVYQYDEVYDEMEKKKEEVKMKEKGDRKPKYIEHLLKTAKQRELENELRKERTAQKERENEGDMFDDKEAFVTSAYKKKIEDLRKAQIGQSNRDLMDDVTDISKQKDLSGFYRYLYRETMRNEPESQTTASTTPVEDSKIRKK